MADPDPVPGRVRLPFWVLQTAELLVALVLVDVAAHEGHDGLLVAGAGVLGLLALTARGPLGVIRICGQRLHRVLCVVAAGLGVLGVVIPSLRPSPAGIVVVVVGAAGLVRLATLTRTDAGGLPAGSFPRTVVDAAATVSDPVAPSATTSPGDTHRADPASPGDGRAASRSASTTTDHLARRAGEAIGTGKAVARQHRPALEAKARRGLRSLGRAVGRIGR